MRLVLSKISSVRAAPLFVLSAGMLVAACGGSPSTAVQTTSTSAAAIATTAPPTTAPPAPIWTQISGQVAAASTKAILAQDSQSSTQWTLTGTTESFSHRLSPGVSGTAITCPNEDYTCSASGALIEPSSGHAQGQTVFAYLARTAANGLTPASTAPYLQFFDNTTGSSVQTMQIHGYPQEPAAGVVDPTEPYPAPVLLAASPSTITLGVTFLQGPGSFTAEILNIDAQTGTVASTDTNLTSTAAGGLTPIGNYIVDPQPSSDSNGCVLHIINTNSLTTESTPTFKVPNNGGTGCPDEVASLAVTPGGHGPLFTAPLTDGYLAALDDGNATGVDVNLATAQLVPLPIQISGPRSTLGAAWQWTDLGTSDMPDGAFNTYTLETGAPAFNLPASQVAALSLGIEGMADNELWVKTSDQNTVVDGATGKTLAKSWSALPLYGAPGWTVVQSDGQQTMYLVRTSEPLYEVTNSNPPTSSG